MTTRILTALVLACSLPGAAGAQTWISTHPARPSDRIAYATAVGKPGAVRKIYTFGGTDGSLSYSESWSYDPWSGWAAEAPLPAPRHGMAAARALDSIGDERIYLFGGGFGAGANIATNTVWSYHTQSGTWAVESNLGFTERKYAAAVTGADGKIYVLGGQDDSGNRLSVVEVYDPLTDSWSPVKLGE